MRGVAPQLLQADDCSLKAFLEATPILNEPNSVHWCWLRQMIRQLGSMLEPCLLGLDIVELSLGHWFDKSLLEADAAPPHSRGQILAAYCANAALFLAGEDVVAVALDDARMGRKPAKLVVALAPRTGHVAGCCPQAPRGCGRVRVLARVRRGAGNKVGGALVVKLYSSLIMSRIRS